MTVDRGRRSPEYGLVQLYHKWFEIVYCNTPELIEQAFRLRYQVYCLETGYFDPGANPDGMETDEYDERSAHSILVHKPTGQVAGTVRLILPDDSHPDGGLPARMISKDGLGMLAPSDLPIGKTAEISRFAVSKKFRRRQGDSTYPASNPESPDSPGYDDRRVVPSITLGLMKAVVEMGKHHGITHVCAVVEPALLRLLRQLGITFYKAGKAVEYHGVRQPVYRDFDSWSASIYEQRPEIWELITDSGRIWPLTRAESKVLA